MSQIYVKPSKVLLIIAFAYLQCGYTTDTQTCFDIKNIIEPVVGENDILAIRTLIPPHLWLPHRSVPNSSSSSSPSSSSCYNDQGPFRAWHLLDMCPPSVQNKNRTKYAVFRGTIVKGSSTCRFVKMRLKQIGFIKVQQLIEPIEEIASSNSFNLSLSSSASSSSSTDSSKPTSSSSSSVFPAHSPEANEFVCVAIPMTHQNSPSSSFSASSSSSSMSPTLQDHPYLIVFPENGHQPTTEKAVIYSCANVDNTPESPITRWYMEMFGVVPYDPDVALDEIVPIVPIDEPKDAYVLNSNTSTSKNQKEMVQQVLLQCKQQYIKHKGSGARYATGQTYKNNQYIQAGINNTGSTRIININ